MASNEQSVTLLRHNKVAQVAALNALGFNLTESARAADFPMYLKWGSGLLDVNIARKKNGSLCQRLIEPTSFSVASVSAPRA